MKTRSLFLFILLISALFSSCRNTSQTAQNIPPDYHTSRNSLDWQGVYTGVLPCADCEGIHTMIRLLGNETFRMETTYLGKSTEVFEVEGRFRWNDDNNSITLEPANTRSMPVIFAVGENRLIQRDMSGVSIESEMAAAYILEKENSEIMEKHWKLFEINGRRIENPGTMNSEAYLVFKVLGNRVYGSGGCNRMGGTFQMEAPGRISFSEIFATKMGCQDMEVEQLLFEVLDKADNYTIGGDTLSLNKARMAPLARFVAVRN
ncbi:MAG: copper resistance protein NlpE N-terminal domain-containing protein [Bacteroidales bacterium]